MWLLKAKAALLHLLVTVCVALLMGVLIFWVWYPAPYTDLAGGDGLFKLVLLVEITLGPLMSLVIFNPNKKMKELVTDYVLIGAVQFAGLFYGVNIAYQARPAFFVFAVDRLELVTESDLDGVETDWKMQWDLSLLSGPQLVGVEFPTDIEEKNTLLFDSLAGGRDIHLLPKYYVPLQVQKLDARLQDLASLRARAPQLQIVVPLSEDRYGWIPMMNSGMAWTAIVERATGKPALLLNYDSF